MKKPLLALAILLPVPGILSEEDPAQEPPRGVYSQRYNDLPVELQTFTVE